MKNIAKTLTFLSLAILLAFGSADAGNRRWKKDFGDDDFNRRTQLSYNRVEGIFLGFIIPKEYDDYYGMGNSLAFYGSLGYGLTNEKIRYKAGLARNLFGRNNMEIGAEYYDLTSTEDSWLMPQQENSLAAFFLHEDFYDYYRAEGYAIYGTKHMGRMLSVTGGMREENISSMEKVKDWSLFRSDEKFRDNPLVDEGSYKSTFLRVRTGTSRHMENWSLSVDAELNNANLKDDMPDYERYVVDLRRYQPLGRSDHLNIRARYGISNGDLPIHKKFDLGGIGSLRGYPFKEFADADKMALINIEYQTDGDAIAGLDFVGPLNNLIVAFFFDAGNVWNDDKDAPELNDLYRNIGIGFGDDDGDFMINIAKPLDGDASERDPVVTMRINYMF